MRSRLNARFLSLTLAVIVSLPAGMFAVACVLGGVTLSLSGESPLPAALGLLLLAPVGLMWWLHRRRAYVVSLGLAVVLLAAAALMTWGFTQFLRAYG